MHPFETLVADMTLSELAQRTGISVTTIVERAVNGKKAQTLVEETTRTVTPEDLAQAAKSKSKSKSKSKAKTKTTVDVRSPAGRAAYDHTVLQVITNFDGDMNAEEIRPRSGGTPTQLLSALHRLTEHKLLKRTGQARGTKYRATDKGHTAANTSGDPSTQSAKAKPKGKTKAKKAPPNKPTKAKTKATRDTLSELDITILKYLRKRNALSTIEEIADGTVTTTHKVVNRIRRLADAKLVTARMRPRDKAEAYAITDKGKKAY